MNEQQWRALAEAGMTATEAARHAGRTLATASGAAKRYGFCFRDGRTLPEVETLTSDQLKQYKIFRRVDQLPAREALAKLGVS